MTSFLAANWIWILLIGGFLFMHFGLRTVAIWMEAWAAVAEASEPICPR